MVAQEKIEQLQKDLQLKDMVQNKVKLTEQATEVSNAAVQTGNLSMNEQSSQTNSLDRKDFQSQAAIVKVNRTITTQTENTRKQNSQVQVNTRQVSESTVQAIKQEVGMPNMPNSVGQSQSKKRRISSISRSISTSTSDESVCSDAAITVSTSTNTEQQSDNVQSEVDPSILNSEVYKIYCQNEDPAKAKEQIMKLKNCISFIEPRKRLPKTFTEEILQRRLDSALEKLWTLGSAKFPLIEKFMNGKLHDEFESITHHPGFYRWHTASLEQVIDEVIECFTKITLLLPIGYVQWHVKNFESGPGLSKWYRGITVRSPDYRSNKMAKLNILGISNSMLNKLHYEYYLSKVLSKHSKKVQWLDFAERIVRDGRNLIFPGKSLKTNFEFTEIQTDRMISVQATFRLLCDPVNASSDDSDYECYDECTELPCIEASYCMQSSYQCMKSSSVKKSFKTFKRYEGVSTRPRKKTRRPKNEKEVMKKEAKKAALMEFFKDRFGFTEFKDVLVDDLFRPV